MSEIEDLKRLYEAACVPPPTASLDGPDWNWLAKSMFISALTRAFPALLSRLEAAEARVREITAELEQTRVQLAGCSVAALGYAEKQEPPLKAGDYGWSASYQDVVNLAARLAAVTAAMDKAREALEQFAYRNLTEYQVGLLDQAGLLNVAGPALAAIDEAKEGK